VASGAILGHGRRGRRGICRRAVVRAIVRRLPSSIVGGVSRLSGMRRVGARGRMLVVLCARREREANGRYA
jgi:hypothetical protein